MGLSHSPKIVTDGLVLYVDAGNNKSYPGSGTTLYDMSGYENSVSLSSATFISNDGAGYFVTASASEYFRINIGHSNILNDTLTTTTGGWTIEEILLTIATNYPEADGPVVASGNAYSNGSTGFDWNHGAYNGYFKSGQSYNSTGAYQDQTTYTIPSAYSQLNKWKIRTVVFNRGIDQNKLYINGVNLHTWDTPNTSGNPIYDGSGITFGTAYGWKSNGKKSIIKIYNRALSDLEIKQNFEALRGRFNL